MKKSYEVTRIFGKVYNEYGQLGFWVDLRDLRDGHNYLAQFFTGSNKRQLVKELRNAGCIIPHRVYRAIG